MPLVRPLVVGPVSTISRSVRVRGQLAGADIEDRATVKARKSVPIEHPVMINGAMTTQSASEVDRVVPVEGVDQPLLLFPGQRVERHAKAKRYTSSWYRRAITRKSSA